MSNTSIPSPSPAHGRRNHPQLLSASMTDLSPGELTRRLIALENIVEHKTVKTEAYNERNRRIDDEIEDLENNFVSHQEGHKWLARLVAGTALSVLVTIIVFILRTISELGLGAQ